MKTPYKKTNIEGPVSVVNCFCGAKILLVPDVKLMSEAIEAHIEQAHKLETVDSAKAEMEAEKVREYLITQVFDKASEK